MRTVADVSEPSSGSSSTRKSTLTVPPSRSTVVTLPTFTPAMRTSSPALSPPASEKCGGVVLAGEEGDAVDVEGDGEQRDDDAEARPRRSTTGLRSRNGPHGRHLAAFEW